MCIRVCVSQLPQEVILYVGTSYVGEIQATLSQQTALEKLEKV